MNFSIMQTEFTADIHSFLRERGYTHILSLGIEPADNLPDGYNENYILQPLKPDDTRIHAEQTGLMIEPITSDAAWEMVSGDEFIRFVIEVPVDEFQVFLNMNS